MDRRSQATRSGVLVSRQDPQTRHPHIDTSASCEGREKQERLDVTRADLIGLLIEKHADTVTKVYFDAYKKLRSAVEALGGTLEHRKRGEPKGGTWVLDLGGKQLRIPSEQSNRYPALDACYRLKEGLAASNTWADHTDVIEPTGLAHLFTRLAASSD